MNINAAIGQRILNRRKALGMTISDLANEIGVNVSTISRYEHGEFQKVKLPIIESIASALHVNPAWLVGKTDDPVDYDDPDLLNDTPLALLHEWQSLGLSASEMGRRALEYDRAQSPTPVHLPTPAGVRVGLLYDRADERDRKLVDTVLAPYDDGTLEQTEPLPQSPKVLAFEPRRLRADPGLTKIDVFDEAAAAGFGNYLSQPSSHIEQYPAEMLPRGTDFGVHIAGDSMEPTIHDGSTAFVQSRSTVAPGDIGIFLLNGQSYCKQLVVDKAKNQVRLHSLNPKYEDIVIREYDDLRTLGRVLGSY